MMSGDPCRDGVEVSQRRTEHVDVVDCNAYAIDDPFGDGNTSRAIPRDARIVPGDRLTAPSETSLRRTASTASCATA